jgi:hypothetical protein
VRGAQALRHDDTQDEQHGGQDEQSGSGEAEGAIMVAMASLLMAEVQTKSLIIGGLRLSAARNLARPKASFHCSTLAFPRRVCKAVSETSKR